MGVRGKFRSFIRSFGHSFSFSFSGWEGGVLAGNNVLVWGFHSFERGSVPVTLFRRKFWVQYLKVCMYCGYDYTECGCDVGWLWIEDAYMIQEPTKAESIK